MAIFLSASVPLPTRDARFFATSDVVAIRDAVKAFIQEFGPTHRIHFGGHPVITPLVSLMMKRHVSVKNETIHLYLSDFFRDQFPEENYDFIHQIYVAQKLGDRAESLRLMRTRMLTEVPIEAAFFIGGMEGIIDEYNMVRELQPNARCFPVASTGGAALQIYESGLYESELKTQLTYRTLFRKISSLLS